MRHAFAPARDDTIWSRETGKGPDYVFESPWTSQDLSCMYPAQHEPESV